MHLTYGGGRGDEPSKKREAIRGRDGKKLDDWCGTGLLEDWCGTRLLKDQQEGAGMDH